MKKFYSIAILLFMFGMLNAQTTFQRIYSGGPNTSFAETSPTSDGGYIVCGSMGSLSTDYLVSKLNSLGKKDNRNPMMAVFSDHLYLMVAISKITAKAINKTPCAIPTIRTGVGICMKYFNGIAIKSKSKNETPSAKPIFKSRLNVVLFSMFVFNKFICTVSSSPDYSGLELTTNHLFHL